MTVTVAIPTYRRRDLLTRCLNGVLAQMPAPDEVLVVARRDDTEAWAIIDAAGSATVVQGVEVQEPGHVPPVLAALAATSSELVAFIDDDAVPEPGWLAGLVDVMRDDSIVCVGGHVETPGAQPINRPGAGTIRWYGQYIGNVASVEASHPVDVDTVMEGNSCWRTSAMRPLEFHPVLARDDASMYGLDLCLQAKAAGGRVVYTSAARIVHTPGPRQGGSIGRDDHGLSYRSYSRNYTLIALRRLEGARRLAFIAWWWIVGERASYGAATAVVDLLRGRTRMALVAASFSGKAEGVRACLNGR